jgi:hypothetical protein
MNEYSMYGSNERKQKSEDRRRRNFGPTMT